MYSLSWDNFLDNVDYELSVDEGVLGLTLRPKMFTLGLSNNTPIMAISSNEPWGSTDFSVSPLAPFPSETIFSDSPQVRVNRTLDFGSVAVGETESRSISVANRGRQDLEVIPIEATMPFSLDDPVPSDSPLIVTLLSRGIIAVSFSPTSIGDVEGTLRLMTNDPDESEIEIELVGHGGPPD